MKGEKWMLLLRAASRGSTLASSRIVLVRARASQNPKLREAATFSNLFSLSGFWDMQLFVNIFNN
jgi:hypothetical protein